MNDTGATSATDTVDARAASIAGRIGLRLPPTAKPEFAERFSGQDDAARLVLVMPDADWTSLRATLYASAPDLPPPSAEANFHLGPDKGEWLPGKAVDLKTAQLPWHDGAESLNLGIATAGEGRTRLFIFWHQL